MEDYYALLRIKQTASAHEIKRAFREQAKQLHPDIAGAEGAEGMRKLLTAYKVLSNHERRSTYDRMVRKKAGFDYRTFLREHPEDLASQAKLVFFELLHFEADQAIAVWRTNGGLRFSMDQYLDREDWMDCTFILAEELEKQGCSYEAFMLFADLVRAERRRPYFKHFMTDLEGTVKELVRHRLKPAVDPETYIACIETLLELGFPPKDEARWLRSMAETLAQMGRTAAAQRVFQKALQRDPGLAKTARLRQKLNV